jgi:hypothetical protein
MAISVIGTSRRLAAVQQQVGYRGIADAGAASAWQIYGFMDWMHRLPACAKASRQKLVSPLHLGPAGPLSVRISESAAGNRLRHRPPVRLR